MFKIHKKSNSGIRVLLFLAVTGSAIAAFISSCGKAGNSSATSMNIQYQVVNLSPDLGPIALYIDYLQYNGANFYYPSPSGYFTLSSIDQPFQIRLSPTTTGTTVVSTNNIFSDTTTLKPNFKYTLFITGFNADSSLVRVFLVDTVSLPAIGRGKIRFINLSPRSTPFDLLANDTPAFKGQAYSTVSPFRQVPAGIYTFQVFTSGTTTGAIGSESNVTIQDGRAYTIYTYGVAGHTDSLAFGMGVITNR